MEDDLTAALGELLSLRQNGEMPTRRELPDLSSNAGRAHEAITGRARVAVLRFLLSEPRSTRPQIAEATGISPGGVRSALLELEALGYVTSDAPAPRQGRRVYYSANRADLTDDLTAFVAWMLR